MGRLSAQLISSLNSQRSNRVSLVVKILIHNLVCMIHRGIHNKLMLHFARYQSIWSNNLTRKSYASWNLRHPWVTDLVDFGDRSAHLCPTTKVVQHVPYIGLTVITISLLVCRDLLAVQVEQKNLNIRLNDFWSLFYFHTLRNFLLLIVRPSLGRKSAEGYPESWYACQQHSGIIVGEPVVRIVDEHPRLQHPVVTANSVSTYRYSTYAW